MTHDLDAWLSAILAKPDDLVTRLTFADWLEERGNAWAEQVRKSYHAGPPELRASVDAVLALWEHSRCLVCNGSGWPRVTRESLEAPMEVRIKPVGPCEDCRGLGHIDLNDPPVYIISGPVWLAQRRQGVTYYHLGNRGQVQHGSLLLSFFANGRMVTEHGPVESLGIQPGAPGGGAIKTVLDMFAAFRRRWDGRLDELVRHFSG